MKLQIEVKEYIKLIESKTELELMKDDLHKDYNVGFSYNLMNGGNKMKEKRFCIAYLKYILIIFILPEC